VRKGLLHQALVLTSLIGGFAAPCRAQEPAAETTKQEAPAPAPAPGQEKPAPAVEPLPGPPPIPEVSLGPILPTVPTARERASNTTTVVDPSVLPKDKQSIWVLDFAFKPVRIVEVERPGKGRKYVYYLYYQVVNRTGKPRMFAPQFTLITDTGKRYEDMVLPLAVNKIEKREDPSIPILGAVTVMGYIPPSGKKEGVDDVLYGVAVWEGVDPKADAFKIYVRGLSDGYQLVNPPDGGTPIVKYKTLRLDFLRPGDERNLKEREIRQADPKYEWIYW
jgi:hypothetical protein